MKRISNYDEIKVNLTPELAEIVGILLGDGGLYKYHTTKYTTAFVFNKLETDYLDYVKKLLGYYFAPYAFTFYEDKFENKLHNNSIYVGKVLLASGMKVGNKVSNDVSIPSWIFEKKFLKYVVRGLFDSDGCVYRKYGHYAQIQFKFSNPSLIESLRDALVCLSFNPTRIQKAFRKDGLTDYKIYLSRQSEIKRFFEEIRPCNTKHVKRYTGIKKYGDAAI